MPQADFAYPAAPEHVPAQPEITIFADRAAVREEIGGDVLAAGLAVRETAAVATLLDGDVRPLADVVLIDCPVVGATELAALARIDLRAARSGARLVISTSIAALDDVFACCDQSAPQILVDPTRAERIVALGQALGETSTLQVRELAEVDRLTLLRLTEQVNRIAERLERFDESSPGQSGAFRFESPSLGFKDAEGGAALAFAPRPPFPDPRLVRRIIRRRQQRAQFFEGALFGDPAWDILLDLTAARAEHTRVSVTSLCIASGVPPTTALRWITQMTAAGLLERVEDEADRRRAFIALSDHAADAMARYFAEVGQGAAQLV